jgi:hypothetical protein
MKYFSFESFIKICIFKQHLIQLVAKVVAIKKDI